MRKLTLLASVAALALAGLTACSDKGADSSAKAGAVAPKTEVKTDSTGRHETPIAQYIRYVDTQRILQNYTLAVEVAQQDSLAQIKLAAYQNQLGAGLQRRQQQIQEKVQRNGYLSEQSYNADIAALQKAQQDAENNMAQRQRDYAVDLMTKQQELNDSVKSVVNEICLRNNLDAILDKTAGLYFNPALDITDEVLAELNRRYQPSK